MYSLRFFPTLIFHAVHAILVNCSDRVKHVNVSIYNNNLEIFFKIGYPATSSITLVDVSTSTPNATPPREYSKAFYIWFKKTTHSQVLLQPQ